MKMYQLPTKNVIIVYYKHVTIKKESENVRTLKCANKFQGPYKLETMGKKLKKISGSQNTTQRHPLKE